MASIARSRPRRITATRVLGRGGHEVVARRPTCGPQDRPIGPRAPGPGPHRALPPGGASPARERLVSSQEQVPVPAHRGECWWFRSGSAAGERREQDWPPLGHRQRSGAARGRRRLRAPAPRGRRSPGVATASGTLARGAQDRESAGAARGGPGAGSARLHPYRAGAVPPAVARRPGRSARAVPHPDGAGGERSRSRSAGPGASPGRRLPTSTTSRCRCSPTRGATRRRRGACW